MKLIFVHINFKDSQCFEFHFMNECCFMQVKLFGEVILKKIPIIFKLHVRHIVCELWELSVLWLSLLLTADVTWSRGKLLLKVYIEFASLRNRTEDFLGPNTQILSSCSTVSKINYFCSSASINFILNLFYHMEIYCEFQA